MPKWYGETQPTPSSSPPWNVGLNVALKPYGLATRDRAARSGTAIVGSTISGANGSDAATAHGASVPSSGPYGTPRAM